MSHYIRIFLLLVLVLAPYAACAQQVVKLRGGEHDAYSRLVFDWPKRTAYSLKDQTSQGLTIAFSEDGKLQNAAKLENLKSLNVSSTSPLIVRIEAVEGSRIRAFAVASRVVVDIYDPPGKKRQKQPVKEQPKKKKTKSVSKASKASKVKDKVRKAVQEYSNVKVSDAKIPSQKVLKPAQDRIHKEVLEPAPDLQKIIKDIAAVSGGQTVLVSDKKEIGQEPHNILPTLLSLSSTSTFGLAAFENYGRLWIVLDKEDPLTKPKVSGPSAKQFEPIDELVLKGGHAYITRAPKGMYVRGEGSGLVWNVIVSPEDKKFKTVEVERKFGNAYSLRGGKLFWPAKSAKTILNVDDPVSGIALKVVTVGDSKDFVGISRSYAEFDVLHSSIGLVIRPKIDDLHVQKVKGGIEISRDGGLSLVSADNVPSMEDVKKESKPKAPKDPRRIFDFTEWRLGKAEDLYENRNSILSSMAGMDKPERIENLLGMAKGYLAHGRGAEALGFLNIAVDELPVLEGNPEFLALRGVAKAFDWKTDEAFEDLSDDILNKYEEIQFWRSFALADLGDWQQAYEVLPEKFTFLYDYPDEIRNRVSVSLAEVVLRAGELEKADELFRLIKKGEDGLNMAQESALSYLKGEAARQRGKTKTTQKLWKDLAKGRDDLYRVKAGLALARLLRDEDKISPADAIDRLERLRYAWRGDELEAQVNYWLGRSYFDGGEYVKGLKIMRQAAGYVPGTEFGKRIASDMTSVFSGFYTGERLSKVSPLDAVSLYEEFSELTPPGADGNQVISRLAERLVQSDLLDRASELLKYQLDHRLTGDEAARTAVRLAAIRIIDQDPDQALQSLAKATELLLQLPNALEKTKRFEEVSLLRARALAQKDQVDQALEILNKIKFSPDVNRLKADIAWNAGYWDDAAFALEDVILDKNISLTRPLEPEDAALILQRTVALNLAGDRIGLANIREKFSEAMSQTEKADLFEVITRPRQNAGLSDRATLLSSVSEVDLFGEFLESYRDFQSAPLN